MFGFGKKKDEIPQDIYPIPHDGVSGTMTTLGSASGKGLIGAGKGFAIGLGGVLLTGAVVGALVGTAILFPGVLPAIGLGGATLGTIGVGALKVVGVIGAALAGAAGLGALIGMPIGGIGGVIFGIGGAAKGAEQGSQRVALERAAAQQVQHQLGAEAMETQALIAQAQAMGHRNAANAYGLPPQGSPMNMASSQINSADIVQHGRLADLQLERA